MAVKPWTEAEDDELRRLHAQNLPANQIRKQMGRALSTISVKAKALGLSFDRVDMMGPAIAASQFDRKAARARIIEKMYARAEHHIDTMDEAAAKGFVTLVPVGGGAQATKTLTHVPTSDERNLSNAIASYLARAEALEKIDADGGMTEAKGLVNSILSAIKDSVAGVDRMNPTLAA